MPIKKNVTDTSAFAQQFYKVMDSIYDLMELAQEDQPEAPDPNSGIFTLPVEAKIPFNVSGRYERPTEFLTSLLDIVRVNFEPNFFGTFLLNANMDFVQSHIPTHPFQLGYASITHEDIENLDFEEFWNTTVQAHLARCGYLLSQANAAFVVVSTAGEHSGMKLIKKVAGAVTVGVTVDQALDSIASNIKHNKSEMTHDFYTGFCIDESLANSLRLSIWMFNENPGEALQ